MHYTNSLRALLSYPLISNHHNKQAEAGGLIGLCMHPRLLRLHRIRARATRVQVREVVRGIRRLVDPALVLALAVVLELGVALALEEAIGWIFCLAPRPRSLGVRARLRCTVTHPLINFIIQ